MQIYIYFAGIFNGNTHLLIQQNPVFPFVTKSWKHWTSRQILKWVVALEKGRWSDTQHQRYNNRVTSRFQGNRRKGTWTAWRHSGIAERQGLARGRNRSVKLGHSRVSSCQRFSTFFAHNTEGKILQHRIIQKENI